MREPHIPTNEEIGVHQNLCMVLDRLPKTPNGHINKSWVKYRKAAVDDYGQDAIATLIPAHVRFVTIGVTLVLNTLAANGVKTMQDLVTFDLATFVPDGRKGFGEKSLALAKALKAVAEVELKRNSGFASETSVN